MGYNVCINYGKISVLECNRDYSIDAGWLYQGDSTWHKGFNSLDEAKDGIKEFLSELRSSINKIDSIVENLDEINDECDHNKLNKFVFGY